jgi:copper chaperone
MTINDTPRPNLLDDATADTTSGGCCGGGGCMCGHGGAQAAAPISEERVTEPQPTADAAEYLVTGMTCGHCVASVRDEVSTVAGVDSVEVALVKGGASRVTVHAAGPIDENAIRAAVEEAGYQLV